MRKHLNIGIHGVVLELVMVSGVKGVLRGTVQLRKTLPWGFAQLVHIAGVLARRAGEALRQLGRSIDVHGF